MTSVNFEDVRMILELMYFVSGIAVPIIGIIALRQLRIAEQALVATRQQVTIAVSVLEQARLDLRTRSLRESITLAAQLCEKYADRFIPRVTELAKALEAKGLTTDEWALHDAKFERSSLLDSTSADAWHEQVDDDTHDLMIDVLNEMEAIAIYFVKGAADESTAYASIGAAFCGTAEQLAPCLIACREDDPECVSSGRFENVLELYSIWRERMRHHRLQADAARVTEQLGTISPRAIAPIGAS